MKNRHSELYMVHSVLFLILELYVYSQQNLAVFHVVPFWLQLHSECCLILATLLLALGFSALTWGRLQSTLDLEPFGFSLVRSTKTHLLIFLPQISTTL